MSRILAFSAFLIAGMVAAAPIPDLPPRPPYFPNRVGDRWTYRFDTALPATFGITQVQRRGSGWVVTEARLKDDGRPTTVAETFLVTDTGVASLSGNRPGDDLGERWLLKLPPGNKRPAAGLTWSWEYFHGRAPMKHHYTFVGEEDVEVPAGKFRAVRVEMWKGNGPEDRAMPGRAEVRWHAPRVGVVKAVGNAISGSKAVMELVSFTPGRE